MDVSVLRFLALVLLFVSEEMGVPVALVLSGIFVYAGSALSQGSWWVFLLVLLNLLGSFMGATGVYWAARAGVGLPILQRTVLARLSSLESQGASAQALGLLGVIGARMAPLPLVFITLGFAAVKLPYLPFIGGVLISTLLWNFLFIVGGYVAGVVSARLPGGPLGIVQYAPVVMIWVVLLVALGVFYRRRTQKKARGQTV
ncbi:MAG: hypothetical protein HY688_01175 [Chloroflexi bacterium]|nr:hypothetical protein [Chloroflexota bacterium]